jgi:hypothetical protein
MPVSDRLRLEAVVAFGVLRDAPPSGTAFAWIKGQLKLAVLLASLLLASGPYFCSDSEP